MKKAKTKTATTNKAVAALEEAFAECQDSSKFGHYSLECACHGEHISIHIMGVQPKGYRTMLRYLGQIRTDDAYLIGTLSLRLMQISAQTLTD